MLLLPAYGRRTNKEQTISDWNNGKDFRIANGPYTSIRDFEALKMDFNTIRIAYYNADGTMGWLHLANKNPLDDYIPVSEI